MTSEEWTRLHQSEEEERDSEPPSRKEMRQLLKELVGTPVTTSDYGITPAQYHDGLDKLWGALGLTGPQDEDVFTLAAKEITTLREQLKSARKALEAIYEKVQSAILQKEE